MFYCKCYFWIKTTFLQYFMEIQSITIYFDVPRAALNQSLLPSEHNWENCHWHWRSTISLILWHQADPSAYFDDTTTYISTMNPLLLCKQIQYSPPNAVDRFSFPVLFWPVKSGLRYRDITNDNFKYYFIYIHLILKDIWFNLSKNSHNLRLWFSRKILVVWLPF